MPLEMARSLGDEARRHAALGPPSGPGWNKLTVAKVDRLVVVCNATSEPGPDWHEFIGYDATGVVVQRTRVRKP